MIKKIIELSPGDLVEAQWLDAHILLIEINDYYDGYGRLIYLLKFLNNDRIQSFQWFAYDVVNVLDVQ